MIKTQKQKSEELFALIKENPDLPIVPMVDSEIIADEGYVRWIASWGISYIDEYYLTDQYMHFKDIDDRSEVEAVLTEEFGYDVFNAMSDEEAKEAYDNLEWIKAIIVNIDVP